MSFNGVGSEAIERLCFLASLPLAGTGQREGGKKKQPFNRFQSRLGITLIQSTVLLGFYLCGQDRRLCLSWKSSRRIVSTMEKCNLFIFSKLGKEPSRLKQEGEDKMENKDMNTAVQNSLSIPQNEGRGSDFSRLCEYACSFLMHLTN